MKNMIFSTIAMLAAFSSHAATKDEITVPFRIEQLFGSRPVVDASIGGKPFRLVVHSNSGSYLQINHANAAVVGAHDLKHVGAYGISSAGHVSDLGRDEGYVDALHIGAWESPKVPVAIFEVPDGSAQGMLGLPFLYANHAVLDFPKKELIFPGTEPSRSLASEMQQRGYAPHPMRRDPKDGRYLIKVSVNGESVEMVVNTVAAGSIDAVYAKKAHVSAGEANGHYAGPSGATGATYDSAKPVSFSIDKWHSRPTTVSIEDIYAYAKLPRPADASMARGGELGADFMIANGAVIDFGNAVLYLKK